MADLDTFTPDNLIAGSFPLVTDRLTVVSGAGALVRGTVLGVITASGKLTTSLSASTDGSQTPNCILAEDVDATSADKPAVVYLTGEFDADALTIGTGHTAASIKAGLRDLSIFLK